MLKTLIITSCTGEKRNKPNNQLVQSDFLNKDILSLRENELMTFKTSAENMYTGMQHLRLMEGIDNLRKSFGREIVDLAIVSAGYGLLSEEEEIVPYEVTFSSMKSKQLDEWAENLNIHNDVCELIKGYDMVFFLLGDKYLRSIKLPLEVKENQRLIFFASKTSKKLIPDERPYFFIEVGQEDAKEFSYGLVGLKGYLFKLLAKEINNQEKALLHVIYNQPTKILTILEKYRKKTTKVEQLHIFSEDIYVVDPRNTVMHKPVVNLDSYAKNYNNFKMKYFIPDWDDRVDPSFNFLTDKASVNRDPYTNDRYAHEIYEIPNYDGILVSKVIIENTKNKKEKVKEIGGIHKFLRFPNTRPIMGDCGAFSYIDSYEPPYETIEILDHYQSLGFDIGVSIDHLIVGDMAKDVDERMRRYNITEKNAEEFIGKYKEGNYTFTPSGIAQGWSPEVYRDSVKNLIDMGYKHISLGGLARSQTKEIIKIMKEIVPVIEADTQLHLFGVARIEPLEMFRRLGITAFDSASHLRRAWLGSGSNYFSLDGKTYAAIRVPQSNGRIVKKLVDEGVASLKEFELMEQSSLKALRAFDHGEISIDETLDIVLAYDSYLGNGREKHEILYRKVLEEQPWKKCDCTICKSIGIEVNIFRGNNRNRRRGFHNTYVFYNQFKELGL